MCSTFFFLTGCVGGIAETDVSDDALGGRILPHFEVATIVGCGGTYECPWDDSEAQCFCQADFDHNNHGRVLPSGERKGHVVVVGSDRRRDEILGMGNQAAHYVNEMNAEWTRGAPARADAMMREARELWPSAGPPRWFLLNEISNDLWQRRDDTGVRYRRYVAELARVLSERHHRRVIVFAPFPRPGRHASDWSALARHAYVGVEGYLSGAAIRDHGFSRSWVRAQYQAMIDAYGRLGVRADRLVMTEHFGNTPATLHRGRGGVSFADWRRAVSVRSRAQAELPVFGLASYAWGFNQMGATNAQRFEIQDLYHRTIGGGTLELPAASSEPAEEPPAPEPTCEAGTIALDGRCVPSCATAGGAICDAEGSAACDGLELLESYDCGVCCVAAPEPVEPEPPPPPAAATCPSGARVPVDLAVAILGDGRAAHCYARDAANCDFGCGNATRTFSAAFHVYAEPGPGLAPLYRCRRDTAVDACARFWLTRDATCEGQGEGARVGTLGYVLAPDVAETCGSAGLRRMYGGGLFDDHLYSTDPAYTPAPYAYEGDVARVWTAP